MSLKVDKRGRLHLSEAQIQKQIIDYLRPMRWPEDGTPIWEVYETHDYHAYRSAGEPGQPDIVAVSQHRGDLVMLRLELKAAGKYPTKEQRDWAERHDVTVYTVHSLDDLRRIIGDSDRNMPAPGAEPFNAPEEDMPAAWRGEK